MQTFLKAEYKNFKIAQMAFADFNVNMNMLYGNIDVAKC